MSKKESSPVKAICAEFGNDRHRMMDIVMAVQATCGCVSAEAIDAIAAAVSCARVEVQSVVSFYAFLSEQPVGKVVVRVCDDVIDDQAGARAVLGALEEALGIRKGETTADGRITLLTTPCIGMSDQAPAIMVNDVILPNLDGEKARQVAEQLKAGKEPAALVTRLGDGNNASDLVRAMVTNNIRRRGPVVFDPYKNGEGLRKALAMTPAEVIRDLKTSRLRGRGGAGFPTGMKWDFTRQADGPCRYVLCNADEGEPGTFKDRVVLTECADLVFEGMTIAGYAIGATEGILYLRGEYAYLEAFLQDVLAKRRDAGLLGKAVAGKTGFDFDIRIQMGAGAYICGEETALISSCEGQRGDPKNRPPFPAQKGYLGAPTTVNNVETFCCVARILENGPGWFAQMGSKGSPGTKLLSVSGDCRSPGVYEVPFGITLREMLEMVGADDAAAVQVGGPSGQMLGPDAFERTICYDDVATGGSVMVFGAQRNVVEIAHHFMEFFCEESCGYCTPCRVGNTLLKNKLAELLDGRGGPEDLAYLEQLGQTVKRTSRCGLGQTSPNPVLSTLANFKGAYEKLIVKPAGKDDFLPSFDVRQAIGPARELTGRESAIYS